MDRQKIQVKNLIGLSINEAKALYPTSIIRVLKKGTMAITMDYCPTRINFFVDSNGKILNVTIG